MPSAAGPAISPSCRLARALAREQEVESGRLDEYCFRHRARKIRLLACALKGRIAGEADPRSLARTVAVQSDEAILEGLRARLVEPVSDLEWDRLVLFAGSEARRQIVAGFGDPDPHRLD